MRFRNSIRLHGQAMSDLRRRVFDRDGNCCVDCGGTNWLELSHNIPRGCGGSDTEENTACRCRACHIKLDLHGQPGHF